jgi:hypothetical protein
VNTEQRQALIERYQDGYRVVVEALANITDAELDAPPPEGWTVREIVHHLADSEMTSAIRLRRLVVEAGPQIYTYDEEAFARVLNYQTRPIAPSLAAFKAARETSASILERLTAEQWHHEGLLHEGVRIENPHYSVETWLEIYAAHAHDHAAQIQRARAALGE